MKKQNTTTNTEDTNITTTVISTNNVEENATLEQTLISALNNVEDEVEIPALELEKANYFRTQTTVRAMIENFRKNKLVIPDMQRMYVWDKTRQSALLMSILLESYIQSMQIEKRDNGTMWLMDGQQRFITCVLLQNHDLLKEFIAKDIRLIPHLFDDKEKADILKVIENCNNSFKNLPEKIVERIIESAIKKILNFRIDVIQTENTPIEILKRNFYNANNGVAMQANVKERSTTLSPEIDNIICTIGNKSFFREFESNGALTVTFAKSGQNILLGAISLLVTSNIEIGETKAKPIYKKLMSVETAITKDVINSANILINRIETVYSHIKDNGIIKRSCNFNLWASALQVMNKTDYSDVEIANLIKHIFAKSKAVKEYSATTSNGTASVGQFNKRCEYIAHMLDKTRNYFDEVEYESFSKSKIGKAVSGFDSEVKVEWNYIPDNMKKKLFVAYVNNNDSIWDSLLDSLQQTSEVVEVEEETPVLVEISEVEESTEESEIETTSIEEMLQDIGA